MNQPVRYVLMTAAKNEGAFVGKMLESVAGQTIQPVKHIVVDDGSSDKTAEIVEQYAKRFPFVELKRNGQSGQRSFGSKVAALRAAYDDLKKLSFDFVGCLDGDITLPPDYYETVTKKMNADARLGLASGLCLQKEGDNWVKIMTNRHHVPGAMQFFRRECYEAIGGYQKVTIAGVDSLAEIQVRMNGWDTRSFTDFHAFHHKPIGSATGGRLKTCYRRGMTDYLLGKHPTYLLLKSVRRLAAPPYVIGAIAHLAGYFGLLIRRHPRDITAETMAYVRSEEMRILKLAFTRGSRPY